MTNKVKYIEPPKPRFYTAIELAKMPLLEGRNALEAMEAWVDPVKKLGAEAQKLVLLLQKKEELYVLRQKSRTRFFVDAEHRIFFAPVVIWQLERKGFVSLKGVYR